MANSELFTLRIPPEQLEAVRATASYYGRGAAAELRRAATLYLLEHSLFMLEDPEVRVELGADLPRVRRDHEEALAAFKLATWARPVRPSIPRASMN